MACRLLHGSLLCSSDKDVSEDYYTYDSIYGEREKIYDQMMNLQPKKAATEQPVIIIIIIIKSLFILGIKRYR